MHDRKKLAVDISNMVLLNPDTTLEFINIIVDELSNSDLERIRNRLKINQPKTYEKIELKN